MADLALWLYGTHIAEVDEPAPFRYRLRFTTQAVQRFGVGSTVLSLGLPISLDPVIDSVPPKIPIRSLLQGFLPEGAMLDYVAQTLGVATTHTLDLLAAVGMECAGAVQFLPAGMLPAKGSVLPLSRENVTAMLESLPAFSAPDGPLPHASLGGLQDKLLLTKTDAGWGWPQGGAASTHILKPEPLYGPVPHLVEAEHWSLHVAQACGLSAASSSLEVFADRPVLVVERYDRTADGERIHQEDFCQALSLPPEAKYEPEFENPPRLRRIARLLSTYSSDPSRIRRDLLRQVTFNAGLGNADAHTKNYSVLLSTSGEPTMAPLYDCAPLYIMNPRFHAIGQTIDHRRFLEEITADALAEEAVYWGMDADEAARTVQETLESLATAAEQVPSPDALPGLGIRVADRAEGLMR